MEHATEAVSILEPFGPSPELARSLAQLAYAVFVYLDDDRTLVPLIDRALLAAETVDDDVARVQVLMVRSQTLYSRGDQRCRLAHAGMRAACSTSR